MTTAQVAPEGMMDGSNDRSGSGLLHIAGLGLALFLGIVIAAVTIAQANVASPSIGDIVALARATEVPRPLDVGLTVHKLDGAAGATCLLQPGVMAARGGSLVVEARRPGSDSVYLAHWAGGRTSAGADDCGSAADVELTGGDLQRLALIAGGFGVDHGEPAGANDLPALQGMGN